MFTVNDIVNATGGVLTQGSLQVRVNAVSIDSRKVKAGELFIAVKGDVFDGHDFINDVVANNVRVLVVHHEVRVNNPLVSIIKVKDTTKALGEVARFHRLRFNIPVIALTGSAGKTTTKEMIAAVLSTHLNVLKNQGTQNNHIGVPLTLLQLTKAHEAVVLECGTNQPGDIEWLAHVARPTVAVFTNIGESHLEKLKSPAGVLKEKWHLTQFCAKGTPIIFNGDDALLAKKAKASKGFKCVTFCIKSPGKYKATHVEIVDGVCLSFKLKGKRVVINSCGMMNVFNALAAFACGELLKVPQEKIIRALKAFTFPPGRGQIMKLGKGWLVDDSYNANPVSMRSAVLTLEALLCEGKKIFIAADMLELGSRAVKLHADIGRVIARSSIDVLICVGTLTKHMAKQARATGKHLMVFTCADVAEAQVSLSKIFKNGDAVLIKGSRRMGMERMREFLLTAPKGEAV